MAYFLTITFLILLAVVSALLASGTLKPSVLAILPFLARRLYGHQQTYLRVVAGFATLLAPIWIVLFVAVLWAIGDLFAASTDVEADDLRWHYLAIGSMLLALGGLIGAPLALIRVWTSERQTWTVEQGHVTDRLTKAIEQLGAEKTVKLTITREDGTTYVDESTRPNIEVRLGAIYALERIAQDSERDHIPVMETLCAYIRENASASDARNLNLAEWPVRPDEMDAEDEGRRREEWAARYGAESLAQYANIRAWTVSLPRPRADIQAALDVIDRRADERLNWERGQKPNFKLDLRRSKLQGSFLLEARLDGADLSLARMEGADLRAARMGGANLRGTRLEGAILNLARLERADLSETRLERASLAGAKMEGVILRGARLEGANLFMARLEGATVERARLEEANLHFARLERAILSEARLEGADLSMARLEGATLERARLEGANLRCADLRSVSWADCQTGGPAHSADLRGAKGLTQNQLDQMIGNTETLLPETLEDGSVPSIPTCWAAPPPFFEAMLCRMSYGIEGRADPLRAQFLCPEGAESGRTGKPLALDEPYPEGHPLANRKD